MYVSEILQLIEIKYLLMVPGLCHFHGMMECWNTVLKTYNLLFGLKVIFPILIFLLFLKRLNQLK